MVTNKIIKITGFYFKLYTWLKRVSNFILKYRNDVEFTLRNELVQSREYWKLCDPYFLELGNTSQLFKWLKLESQVLEEVIPNY